MPSEVRLDNATESPVIEQNIPSSVLNCLTYGLSPDVGLLQYQRLPEQIPSPHSQSDSVACGPVQASMAQPVFEFWVHRHCSIVDELPDELQLEDPMLLLRQAEEATRSAGLCDGNEDDDAAFAAAALQVRARG